MEIHNGFEKEIQRKAKKILNILCGKDLKGKTWTKTKSAFFRSV